MPETRRKPPLLVLQIESKSWLEALALSKSHLVDDPRGGEVATLIWLDEYISLRFVFFKVEDADADGTS